MAERNIDEVLRDRRSAEANFEEAARALVWAEREYQMVYFYFTEADKEVSILGKHFEIGLDISKKVLTHPRRYRRRQRIWWWASAIIVLWVAAPLWVVATDRLKEWGW